MKKQTIQKPKSKKDNVLRYEKPLKLDMSFEEAIKRIVRVKPEEVKK